MNQSEMLLANNSNHSSHETNLQHQHFHRQYNLNVSNSSSPKQQQQQQTQSSSNLQNNNSSPKQPIISSNQSSANIKQQLQYQQQSAAAVAAASAAAEYFEQQLKMQQHKNSELDQHVRLNLEQIKELKEKVTSLNEINRKLYDENQQFKERSLEQRQQIEQYHSLFQENQQKHDQALLELKKERDQYETEMKRRCQQTLDSRQHENFAMIGGLKEKMESLRANENLLMNELSAVKQEMQQDKGKTSL
jgi:hypothetical protein